MCIVCVCVCVCVKLGLGRMRVKVHMYVRVPESVHTYTCVVHSLCVLCAVRGTTKQHGWLRSCYPFLSPTTPQPLCTIPAAQQTPSSRKRTVPVRRARHGTCSGWGRSATLPWPCGSGCRRQCTAKQQRRSRFSAATAARSRVKDNAGTQPASTCAPASKPALTRMPLLCQAPRRRRPAPCATISSSTRRCRRCTSSGRLQTRASRLDPHM